MLFFAKANKAWFAALAAFLSTTTMTFFGFELDPAVQVGIATVAAYVVTWLSPKNAA